MQTSLSCLTLEIYYRYLPLFKADVGPGDGGNAGKEAKGDGAKQPRKGDGTDSGKQGKKAAAKTDAGKKTTDGSDKDGAKQAKKAVEGESSFLYPIQRISSVPAAITRVTSAALVRPLARARRQFSWRSIIPNSTAFFCISNATTRSSIMRRTSGEAHRTSATAIRPV